MSKSPLKLVYSSYVWGPTINSVGRKKIILDSLMISTNSLGSICLSLDRPEVFQKFHEFQALVEILFTKKIIQCKPIGEASTKSSMEVGSQVKTLAGALD